MIVSHWKATISLQRTLTWPVEEGEIKQDIESWMETVEGKKWLLAEFIKFPRVTGYQPDTDISIEEFCLQEIEVKASDYNPRI